MEGIGSTKLICTSKKRKLLTFAMHWHQSHVRNKIHCTALKRGPCKTIITASPGAFAPARKREQLTYAQVLLQLTMTPQRAAGVVVVLVVGAAVVGASVGLNSSGVLQMPTGKPKKPFPRKLEKCTLGYPT